VRAHVFQFFLLSCFHGENFEGTRIKKSVSKNKKMRKMCAKKKMCEERKFAIKGITNTVTRENPLFY
jgi:hypothetical protein